MASAALLARAVTVRDARPADLGRIGEIWNPEILRTDTTTDTEPRDAAALAAWLGRHGAAWPVVVAVADDEVLAFGALSPYRPTPAFARTAEDSVYVARDRRGEGLGRRVLDELLRRAAAAGHHSVLARVTAPNTASLRLHARAGFRTVGVERETAFKLGRWLDVVVLQRVLAGR
ncbi:MAG: hypothetical protein A3E31_16710 [Candidatus Rokubacteria bacterium RIFCSPHIGHO2_12_FULL_73_22]|nr:MAG: hypothetical protein A3D33_11620 [Candidatus Rokubacteria bacterium RIFCSPHIGHO2_02_FULL_73_26]OGL03768.1 MAG: hypothetical protein A3E31_16710 [Candidatus Rokubacteria bacterium RIFCSPHIGHO2_12_FULL_73_22]OGL12388.1 MAG: hypothetical protein A3I14_05160 [Candidatus Rokubacteria bacterium RIFCSPLOWO2_02_FULL_73_56]OGL28418.1 MAG: hypothetical protein A3G44_05060 [Candidatus Rokubacteria bacterium RIFCSPLOWO2_12_FULL_73_47]